MSTTAEMPSIDGQNWHPQQPDKKNAGFFSVLRDKAGEVFGHAPVDPTQEQHLPVAEETEEEKLARLRAKIADLPPVAPTETTPGKKRYVNIKQQPGDLN